MSAQSDAYRANLAIEAWCRSATKQIREGKPIPGQDLSESIREFARVLADNGVDCAVTETNRSDNYG